MERIGKYFSSREDGKIKCSLCPVGCVLKAGQRGICQGRYNNNGEMVVTNYGEVVSLCIDPIEKKPLYHFYPGSVILSTGPNGCNLKCANCQNWNISQEKAPTDYISPEAMASISRNENSIGVAYTYTEPFIWFEYLLDTMPLVRDQGGFNVLVTNGYVMLDPLNELLPHIDAINIDLKSIEDSFYRKICHGRLKNVQDTILKAIERGVHIEITNLLITGLNDSVEQITKLVDWLGNVPRGTPLHFSRYFPTYKLDNPATSAEILKIAYLIAKEKMDYVYVGNLHIEGTSDTFCPAFGALLISRSGYRINIVNLKKDRCGQCGFLINMRNS